MDITIHLDDRVYDTLRRSAREESLSAEELICQLLKEYADKEERLASSVKRWKSGAMSL